MQSMSVKLANGEVVVPNDHVYVSLPWSDRDGTPYNIARIIEFLPPSHMKKGARVMDASASLVRLSLYYRPADISARNVADYRLLLAAIYTDVQPISSVRGKCYVKHKDRVGDLLEWKRLPDHFYFAKFFDPYIKREFEVIPTETVHNIPHHVKVVLQGRYEYIVTEKELVADLTDDFRSCCRCQGWASYQESVKCDTCKEHYHMKCLQPPLHAKPAKGYSWFRFGLQSSSGTSKVKSGKAKHRKAVSEDRPAVTFRGWQWRYFGVYTRTEDVLDPEDPIFPRAATRVGPKYQATVPSWEDQPKDNHKVLQIETVGSSLRQGAFSVERGHDDGDKKYGATIELISRPSSDLDGFMEDARNLDLAVPPWDVDRLNLAISSFTTLGAKQAMNFMRTRKLQDFNPATFTAEETSLFESELERVGGLDTYSCSQVLHRSSSEILRYFYIWKNDQLKFRNEALRQHHPLATTHSRQTNTLGPPPLGKVRSAGDDCQDDDSASVYAKHPEGEKEFICATCSTRLGEIWWKCPRTVQGEAMCNICGSNYRKYGVITFSKSEDSKKVERKDISLKRVKNRDIDLARPGAISTSRPPQQLCSCCRRGDPKRPLYHCKNCGIVVHSGCYGIDPLTTNEGWQCELCSNLQAEEYCLNVRCVLCPIDPSPFKVKRKHTGAFDWLSAYKPSEGRRWTHVLCSIWARPIRYTSIATMSRVEGIMSLTHEQELQCELCGANDGFVSTCNDCGSPCHPSCAWLAGRKLGFEFSLAKLGRSNNAATIVKFKDSEGIMAPGIWCQKHDIQERNIYDAFDFDLDTNEVRTMCELPG
ncbi:hypothetical protein IAR50_006440 [Cryptococcus sp. DSM 104548]